MKSDRAHDIAVTDRIEGNGELRRRIQATIRDEDEAELRRQVLATLSRLAGRPFPTMTALAAYTRQLAGGAQQPATSEAKA